MLDRGKVDRRDAGTVGCMQAWMDAGRIGFDIIFCQFFTKIDDLFSSGVGGLNLYCSIITP